jgi:hypothetical protein
MPSEERKWIQHIIQELQYFLDMKFKFVVLGGANAGKTVSYVSSSSRLLDWIFMTRDDWSIAPVPPESQNNFFFPSFFCFSKNITS